MKRGRQLTPPNDWEVKKCLRLSLALLLVTLGLIGLAALGFDIPGLRQIVGFIFLTFVPGILILRILKIHNVGIIESLVYSVGLSLVFVMFSGMFINFTLPPLAISKPISPMPVTIALAVFTLILMGIAYLRDKGFTGSGKATPGQKLQLPPILLLVLLLLLTILSVVLIDAYGNNILLLICLITIVAVVGLAAFGKFIKPTVYPLAIFIIGLCLLYQATLMSPYLIGCDIYAEHYSYRLVADSGFWDASLPSTINSCLSITILAPIYSLVLNIDGLWMFKAVYPLLFSLVPLILFHIFSQQMSPRKAFLAAFFFVAVPTFSLEMIALCRQQVAELFLALVILLLVDRRLNLGPRLTLAGIFAMSIVVSHYAIGFIGFLYMGLFLPVVFIIRSGAFRKVWGWLTGKFGGLPRSLTTRGALPAKAVVIVVAIYFIFGFGWYGTTASGVNLNLISRIWTQQINIVTTEVGKLAPEPTEPTAPTEPTLPPTEPTLPPTEPSAFFQFRQRDVLVQTALGLDFPQASPQGKGFRILQYITQLFLIVGCLKLVFRPRHLRFAAEYIALSVTSALLLLACIFLPGFANALNTTRWYHIALITLAPFCILGGEAIWLGVSSLWRKIRHLVPGMSLRAHYHPVIASEAKQPGLANAEDSPGFLRFMALAVLIPYFLFTSGFIYEVTGQEVTDRVDTPYSIALSSHRLDLAGVFYWQDGAAAQWLAQSTDDEAKVYTDSHTGKLLKLHEFSGHLIHVPRDASELQEDGYIYFTAWNLDKGEVTFAIAPGLRKHISFADIPGLTTAIESKNRIYANGGAQILAPK